LEDHCLVKIKLDENLSRQLKVPLSQRGHDVSTALEEGLLGKIDVEVGAAAKSEDRMIFTLDLDFADLRRFPPGSHPGVVLFRPRSMGPLAVNQFVLRFAQQTELSELARCLAIVEPHRIRVRRPSLLDEPGDWEEISLEKDK
jgi:predicted nuclease of predicted toxin-antitoxin system